MRKIRICEVLRALCEEVPISKNNNRPVTKKAFKAAMLSSNLITNRVTINDRWEQLYNSNTLIETHGTVHSRKEQFVILDTIAVENAFYSNEEPLPYGWNDPRNVDIDRERDTCETPVKEVPQ